MTTDIVETWERFNRVLKLYGKADLFLSPPSSTRQFYEVERVFDFELPPTLKALLAINNGQRIEDQGTKHGIFKSISGWDVYERHVFLGIKEIEIAYKTFIDDNVLLTEFGASEIPFAVAGSSTQYKEAFCINRSTGMVSLIWTDHIDPFNPAEWQVRKFMRAESLVKFIDWQIDLYR